MKRQESNLQLPRFKIDIKENGKCVVFFNEFISTELRQDEEKESVIYVYSTYELETNYRSNMEQELEKNYELWLSHAKEIDKSLVAAEAREKRNCLLAECDYTQVEDAALTEKEKQAYQIYRQELRDISEQEGFPYEIKWPDKP